MIIWSLSFLLFIISEKKLYKTIHVRSSYFVILTYECVIKAICRSVNKLLPSLKCHRSDVYKMLFVRYMMRVSVAICVLVVSAGLTDTHTQMGRNGLLFSYITW